MIVGFPGETEADFQKTLAACEAAGFMKIHVFPFSVRRGTPAASFPGQVRGERKKERCRRLSGTGTAVGPPVSSATVGQAAFGSRRSPARQPGGLCAGDGVPVRRRRIAGFGQRRRRIDRRAGGFSAGNCVSVPLEGSRLRVVVKRVHTEISAPATGGRRSSSSAWGSNC